MSKPLLLVVFGVAFAAADDTAAAVMKIVKGTIYPMIDVDANGAVTAAEFKNYAERIGFCPPKDTTASAPAPAGNTTNTTQSCGSNQNTCTEAFGAGTTPEQIATQLISKFDSNDDKGMSLDELLGAAGLRRRLNEGRALVGGFDCVPGMLGELILKDIMPDPNAATGSLDTLTQVDPAILAAVAKVVAVFKADANMTPKKFLLEKMKTLLAAATGVPTSAITTKVSKSSARRRSRNLAAAAYDIELTAYFGDAESADAAAKDTTKMDPFKKNLVTEMAPMGVAVDESSVAVAAVGVPGMAPMPIGDFASAAILLAFLGISCGLAGGVSKMKAKKADIKGGCCDAGCCSYFAIKGWSGADVLSAIMLLIGCLMLFSAMSAFAAAVESIIVGVTGLLSLKGESIEAVTSSFSAYGETLDLISAQLSLLPIAAIVPGLLAAMFLLISSICGFVTKGESYCCAKIPVCLSMLILLLCLVFYFIMTVVSLALYLPAAQHQLRGATSMCDSAIPTLSNLKLEIVDSVALAESADMPIPEEVVGMVTTLNEAVTALDGLCTAFANDLIISIESLLGPCIFGLICTLWAYFNTFGLCCSEGCCSKPKQTGTHGGKTVVPV